MARDYLEIERVRVGERLRYDIVTAPGTEDALLPRLALQTIVENSVKYAVAPRREGGHIVIRADHSSDALTVSVGDDGPGFENDGMPDGHGLALVRDRLRLTLGDRAELVIHSRPGETRVAIVVRAS
jgi:sensor histidine kinase YesM